jgi:hypothetical protein
VDNDKITASSTTNIFTPSPAMQTVNVPTVDKVDNNKIMTSPTTNPLTNLQTMPAVQSSLNKSKKISTPQSGRTAVPKFIKQAIHDFEQKQHRQHAGARASSVESDIKTSSFCIPSVYAGPLLSSKKQPEISLVGTSNQPSTTVTSYPGTFSYFNTNTNSYQDCDQASTIAQFHDDSDSSKMSHSDSSSRQARRRKRSHWSRRSKVTYSSGAHNEQHFTLFKMRSDKAWQLSQLFLLLSFIAFSEILKLPSFFTTGSTIYLIWLLRTTMYIDFCRTKRKFRNTLHKQPETLQEHILEFFYPQHRKLAHIFDIRSNFELKERYQNFKKQIALRRTNQNQSVMEDEVLAKFTADFVHPRPFVEARIEDALDVDILIDTGACASIISKDLYEKLRTVTGEDFPILKSSHVLYAFGGSKITDYGFVPLSVSIGNQ